jgi:hypothetical protein
MEFHFALIVAFAATGFYILSRSLSKRSLSINGVVVVLIGAFTVGVVVGFTLLPLVTLSEIIWEPNVQLQLQVSSGSNKPKLMTGLSSTDLMSIVTVAVLGGTTLMLLTLADFWKRIREIDPESSERAQSSANAEAETKSSPAFDRPARHSERS